MTAKARRARARDWPGSFRLLAAARALVGPRPPVLGHRVSMGDSHS